MCSKSLAYAAGSATQVGSKAQCSPALLSCVLFMWETAAALSPDGCGVAWLRRWTNNHAMRIEPGSQLSFRIMETALRMPFNHKNFTGEVMEKLCKPNGYITVRS